MLGGSKPLLFELDVLDALLLVAVDPTVALRWLPFAALKPPELSAVLVGRLLDRPLGPPIFSDGDDICISIYLFWLKAKG